MLSRITGRTSHELLGDACGDEISRRAGRIWHMPLRRNTNRHEHLGENCVPSGYDLEVIDRFVPGRLEHRRPPRSHARSASAGLVDQCPEQA
jgi:hypothetical protein